MLALALTVVLAAAPAGLDPDADPSRPEALLEPPAVDRRDPCEGRQGWVGDGEDGRDPPACEGPERDADADAAGLHAPDWLWAEEGREADDGTD